MRSRPLHALVSVFILFGTALAVTPTVSATAAPSTECTIRGSSGPDVLVGTPRRDVICGFGGNDVLRGRGGNDLLKGGPGADRLDGGAGDDVLLSGAGADKVSGGAGDDRIDSGAMADVVDGGDGADVLYGDRGADLMSGGRGADRLVGQAGADVLVGDEGTDALLGGEGNDDLDGGPHADELNGGEGTNWCTVGAEDIQKRCVYDLARPEALQVTTSATKVDVTNADRAVTVRVRVTDDTGAQSVRIGPTEQANDFPFAPAVLESGTVRDGWWEATLVFRRWSLPGTYRFSVTVTDRIGRRSNTQFESPVIEVRDDNPDTELPRVVALRSPTPDTTVDVTTQHSSVDVRARLTDALSGVSYAEACIHEPLVDGRMIALYCATMKRRSGDIHDGVWSADIGILKGSVSGDWNVEIYTTDRASSGTLKSISWLGPDLWDAWGAGADPATQQPIPNDRGRFSVVGRPRANDSIPPKIVSAVPTPSEVDTLAGPARVTFTVRATDSGSGVRGVGVGLVSADPDGPQDLYESLTRTSGTAYDGTWTDSIVLPQGTPPGTYYLEVITWDWVDNQRTYTAAGHPDPSAYTLPGDATVTVVDSTP